MPHCARFNVFAILTLLGVFTGASGAEPAKCRYRLGGQLPLQYHGAAMQVTVAGQVNYTPAVLLLDTGSTDTFLTRLGTDKRSMRLEPSLSAVTGIGGTSRLYRARIRQFQIGPINSEQQNGSLMVIDEMGMRPDFDAIVGSDFLLGMDVEISLADKVVKFFSPLDCKQTFLGYWDPKAVVVPMLGSADRPRPLIEIALNGVTMKALIDSGASGSSVTRAGAARAGVAPSSSGASKVGESSGVGNQRVAIHNARFATFSVGEETIKYPTLKVFDGKHEGFDVILGTDFLRAHRVLLAVSQKAVYLSYIGGAPFDDGKSTAWIEKEARDGNGYGQFHMAMAALGSGDSKSESAGREWLQKAVAGKNPLALHYAAKEHGRNQRHADSVLAYEQLIALDSHDLTTQLELFAMRTRTGQGAAAKAGLTAAIAQFRWPRWPAPIADYYLGASTLDDVLRQARKDDDVATRRECEVHRHAHALQAALGQAESSTMLAAKARASCAGQGNWDDHEEG